MEIRRINYPSNDFYKFGEKNGAIKVPDDVIEEWVNECVKRVKEDIDNNLDPSFSYTASGDTIVFAYTCLDSKEISVIVAKGYEEASFFVDELKKREDGLTLCSREKCILKRKCKKHISNFEERVGTNIEICDLGKDKVFQDECENFEK